MPFKSEKQRRYLWANEPEIAREWTDRYGARGGGSMSWADQGGMKNYLGEQPMVNAPKNWRSGPDSPPTELAYITQPEKELILRSNLHGSLQNGPNEGPSGIMSLDSQGDYTRDRSPQGRQSSPGGPDRSRIAQDKHEDHMRSILTGQKNIGQTSAVSERTRRGAVPEWVERPDGTMAHVGSAYKDTGRRGWLSKLFGGANKYGYGQTYGTGSGRFFDRKPSYSLVGSPGRQRYVATDPRIGQLKPGWGGRILGGLASLVTGIPFVGSTIGSAIDKYKPKSYWDKLPDSEKRRLNALNITPYNEQKISIQNDIPMDSLSLQNFSKDPLTNKLSAQNYNWNKRIATHSRMHPYHSIITPAGWAEMENAGIENTNAARDFPLKGTQTLDKYIQPEEWQTQDFPVRSDFIPRDYKSIYQRGTRKPIIRDEWETYKW